MLLDSAAEIDIAGKGWQSMLQRLSSGGLTTVGLGKQLIAAQATGWMTISLQEPHHHVPSHIFHQLFGLHSFDNTTPPPIPLDPQITDEVTIFQAEQAAKPRSRKSRFTPITTADEVAARLGIVDVKILRSLHKNLLGVNSLGKGKVLNAVDDAHIKASMKRRKAYHHGTVEGLEAARETKVGARWYVDSTPQMPITVEGYQYALLFIDSQSIYMFLVAMRRKTSEEWIAAIERLRVFVESSAPGRRMEEIYGDFDCAMVVNGRGDLVETAALLAYKSKYAIRTRHMLLIMQILTWECYLLG